LPFILTGAFSITTHTVFSESAKLHADLQKVEQLESKITTELDVLKTKINKMTEELEIYSDLDKLRYDSEAKKKVGFHCSLSAENCEHV
jgi:intraflagellar transport protein 74